MLAQLAAVLLPTAPHYPVCHPRRALRSGLWRSSCSAEPGYRETNYYSSWPKIYKHTDRFNSVHWNSDATVVAPSIALVKKMNALSTAIRQKERWWEKVQNDAVVLKWAAESKLGAESFDRVIAELRHLADTRVRPEARPAPVDGVFESDGAVPPDALAALRNGADQLAADGPRDVHPGSNGLVIDLVHPSLYPFIGGLSDISDLSDAASETEWAAIGILLPMASQRPSDGVAIPPSGAKYQWLPTLFRVSDDGTVSAASYINNLDGSCYPEMVSGIECALSACLPLMEEVLTELRRDGAPFNMRSASAAATVDPYALWEEQEAYFKRTRGSDASDEQDDLARLDILRMTSEDEFLEEYVENRLLIKPPRVLPFEPPVKLPPSAFATLRGRDLRVIVKLANIELTPQQPAYPGGTWHVEGEPQECIVATALVYYDSSNITPSALAFRRPVNAFLGVHAVKYEQDDVKGFEEIYGEKLGTFPFEDREIRMSELAGEALAVPGRCLAFPNAVQHRVAPFRLEDETMPGHRRLLAFFLVDPAVPIVSTQEVAPQQGRISRTEALEHREELMSARKSFNQYLSNQNEEDEPYGWGQSGWAFESDFSLCEH